MSKNLRKKSKPLLIIAPAALGALLLLWVLVLGPDLFSHKMLADIYPGNAHNRGLQADDYVPDIPTKDADGQKAVVLLREVHYTRFLRTQPVDWSCNNKYLADAYKTTNPEEVRYIVYVNKYRSSVGKYTNKGFASRVDFAVSIIDRSTGEILGNRVFRGEDPPSQISSTSSGGVGKEPPAAEVKQWVDSVLP